MYYVILEGLRAFVVEGGHWVRKCGKAGIAMVFIVGLWQHENRAIEHGDYVATQTRAFADLRKRRGRISVHRAVAAALLRQADAAIALQATFPAEANGESAGPGRRAGLARGPASATYCSAWVEIRAALDAADARFVHSGREGCGHLTWPEADGHARDAVQLRGASINNAIARIDVEIASLDPGDPGGGRSAQGAAIHRKCVRLGQRGHHLLGLHGHSVCQTCDPSPA